MPNMLSWRLHAAVAAAALGASMAWAAAPANNPAGTTRPALPEAFAGLPELRLTTTSGSAQISAGTDGAAPPTGVYLKSGGGGTVAILGSLAPADGYSDKYLQMAVTELNLLRPDMVLTTGNLVPGMTRDTRQYADAALALRQTLDALKMPWYACAGGTDILSGARTSPGESTADLRFEQLYQKYLGPLYYSVTAGDIHAIVLDSEERGGASAGIGDGQLKWLREDLNRTFEGKNAPARAKWVIVVVHKALWRGKDTQWDRVQDMLVEFNRRPIVSLEGLGSEGNEARGPRVAAVFAGGERAYAMDPVIDGIRYYALGPTGAVPRLGEDTDETLRHVTLLKFDGIEKLAASGGAAAATTPGSGGMHAAIVQLGPHGGAAEEAVVADDVITARERAVIDAIAAWDDGVIGIEGMIDEHGEPVGGKLKLHLTNPLADDVDLQFRMAGTRNLQVPARREIANVGAEGFDLPWELDSSHMIRHLVPGAKDGWEIALHRPEKYEPGTDNAPPQVEIVVHWNDPRGRMHEIILKRRVTVVPHVDAVVSSAALQPAADEAWNKAIGGSLYAWRLRGDEPKKLNPTWQLAADDQRLYARIRVEDAVHSYWPIMALDPKLGGIASDAVSFAWAKGTPGNEHVQRVWVLPFAPRPTAAIPPTRGPGGGVIEGQAIAPVDMWISTGNADRQTELQHLDPKLGISASVTIDNGGYIVTLLLPRKLIQQDPGIAIPPPPPPAAGTPAATQPARPVVATAILNIAVHDNDEGPRTWTRSWANEEAGPVGWAHVQFLGPQPPPPATAPQSGFPGIPGLPNLPFHFP